MEVAFALFVVGLLVGPVLGIAVDRVVERERPAFQHRCARCGAELGAPVPIVSWLRRCPVDADHPRWRYAATDVGTATAFAVAGSTFGLSWQLWPYLAFFAVLVVLAVVDIETHLLVDLLTLRLLPAALVGIPVLGALAGFDGGTVPALVTGAALGVFFLGAFLAYPPGMGFGDVKLVPSLGLFLGWMTTSVADGLRLGVWTIVGALLGSAVVGLVMRAWAARQPPERFAHQPDEWLPGEVPLGPFLVIATIVTVSLTTPASLG